MSRFVAVSLVAALCALGPTAPANAKCARVLLAPQVLTHAADPIPRGGGVLVGYTSTTDDGAEQFEGHDPAVNDDWVLVVGKRKLRPRIEVLAPGLAVYRPGVIRGARLATLALRDGAGRKLAGFTASTRPTPGLATAPTGATITSVSSQSNRGRDTRTLTTVTVTLAAAAPAGAVALIAYAGGAQSAPIAWGRVAAGATAIEIYDSPGRCGSEPDGLRAPAPGDTIALTWVDGFGQRSPRSAPIIVK
ncbi:MAG: hypothetical protein IPL61_37630 [Myxococcales bacterium]|nr:hypothetical protein [Myxococcales bacterium]